MEGEILKEALEIATGPKKPIALAVVAEGKFPMTAVCETLVLPGQTWLRE
ncbi:hypothetical protein DSM25559_4860 [Agrobacterium rosae]|uniref:Uncharacterized protein n=1 Tax=Agrobacterium rosae TaxID=1972867 RepID=A0A1R3U3S1_9HYPH|nr:hypothetical protein DSM25559_4860 [Agrobacterium rosae]